MGRAMALEFARLGAGVVVAGRRPEPLEEVAVAIRAARGRALAQPTDVRQPDQVDALFDAAVRRARPGRRPREQRGRQLRRASAEDLSPNGWRAVVSIVLDGGFLCARAAAKKMMEQRRRRRDPERARELCVDGRARGRSTRPRPRRDSWR